MLDIFQGAATPLTAAGLTAAASKVGAEERSIWAVLKVETSGFGYLPDRRPQILFERHIFHGRTDGRFSASYPDISNPDQGGYSGGADEYMRLKRAMLLDRRAALESASWGLGQIMGYHAPRIGYDNVEDMVSQFVASEDKQLTGCVQFINANPALKDALTSPASPNWSRFAHFYNGKKYYLKKYDAKLAMAYDSYSTPDFMLRNSQAYLSYLNFRPGPVDGQWGNRTDQALRAFAAYHKPTLVPPTGPADKAALAKALAALQAAFASLAGTS